MDSDTIKNLIINLGRNDFKRVVSLLLNKIFNFKAIDVDGPWDGGSDWLLFSSFGNKIFVGFQDTLQIQNYEKKAVEDAQKAIETLQINTYYFVTSRPHSNTTMRTLENKIASEVGINSTCLSAREISELICENNLITEFLDAIGAPLAKGIVSRPDKHEILLHSFSIMSSESHDLRNTVYDDSISITLKNYPNLSRNELLKKVIELLSFDSNNEYLLNKRIDSLLTKGILYLYENKILKLSQQKLLALENSERIYLAEFHSLSSAQISLMQDEFGQNWSKENSEIVSLFLARCFIKAQLDCSTHAGVKLSSIGLIKHIGDPFQELRDYLQEAGVPVKKIDIALQELIDQSKDLPIVKKLARTAIFVALEGSDILSSAKALGAPSWSDVIVMLDASVAIPYLCAALYTPITDRFFEGTHRTIKALLSLDSKITISNYYINECASHLLQALDYINLDQFEDSLCYSENAYISNYFQLKRLNVNVPENLKDYIAFFAPASKKKDPDINRWIRKVMTELQSLLTQYSVEFEFIPNLSDEYRKDFEEEYDFILHERKLKKKKVLLDHDVFALGHSKRQVVEESEHRMILTWDRIMIEVGQKMKDCGWIVSPDIASDFLQPYRPLNEKHFCHLAHAIAKTQAKPLEVSARIIDKVVSHASQKLQDWEFVIKLEQFRKNLLERVDFSKREYFNWVDTEIEKFLHKEGVSIKDKDQCK